MFTCLVITIHYALFCIFPTYWCTLHASCKLDYKKEQINTLQVNTLQINTLQVNTLQVNTLQVNTLQVIIISFNLYFQLNT